MVEAVIFGGTTEGRKLCEFCSRQVIPVRYCVATVDGARAVEALPHVYPHIKRLTADEMAELFAMDHPALIIDATHPYALEAGRNIKAACRRLGVRLLRVKRDPLEEEGCLCFNNMDDLLHWLKRGSAKIFVATGANQAKAFTQLPDFRDRVWLRILPSPASLHLCLDLGYLPERLICMQGPFSEELNRAMFLEAGAEVLVTKNSGKMGGFTEKIQAAKILGMAIAVLSRPGEAGGSPLEAAYKRLMELKT